jgi:hypothetical protein
VVVEKYVCNFEACMMARLIFVQLDETSRALLKKLLDDATRQALLKQAKVIC